jgi:hypothetical protein
MTESSENHGILRGVINTLSRQAAGKLCAQTTSKPVHYLYRRASGQMLMARLTGCPCGCITFYLFPLLVCRFSVQNDDNHNKKQRTDRSTGSLGRDRGGRPKVWMQQALIFPPVVIHYIWRDAGIIPWQVMQMGSPQPSGVQRFFDSAMMIYVQGQNHLGEGDLQGPYIFTQEKRNA